MTLPTIIQTLPFYQQLALTLITVLVPVSFSTFMLYLLFKTDFFTDLMLKVQKIMGKDFSERSYKCNCERCRYQLTTKKGLREWRKDHKFRREDEV